MTPGHVSLVGAGPGDPGLLTRTAIARLRSADLVLYDALVGDRILRYARRAQRFFVGKRAGRHAMSQPAINALMIRAARRGKRVVRLKGGDPFVFGRGGEEALALQHAGVGYDVVPGITSAVAAPAAAGIPVTHRGVASAFLVVSAHEESAFASAIAALPPNRITIVVLMGLGRSAAIACRLIDNGWSRGTPAAIVVDATKAQQQVWRGTLGELAADAVEIDGDGAGTIVVGDVVAVGLRAGDRSPERLALHQPERKAREPFTRAPRQDEAREPFTRALRQDEEREAFSQAAQERKEREAFSRAAQERKEREAFSQAAQERKEREAFSRAIGGQHVNG